jgi:diguanylate cyclase (GGDEF)-like protein
MDDVAAQPLPVGGEVELRARIAELARELGEAALRGDTRRSTRLLSELLRFKRLTPERRLALERLTHLIDSMCALAMSDELTGVYNRRGFLQIGRRFLDVARRDLSSAYLVYFDLNNLKEINDTVGHMAGDALIRQTAQLLRELFPNYGVHEVLGRLGGDEFAALTLDRACPSRNEILLRARLRAAPEAGGQPLSLSVGLAYFNPLLPTDICELLASAERAMYEHKRSTQLASSRLARTLSGSAGRAPCRLSGRPGVPVLPPASLTRPPAAGGATSAEQKNGLEDGRFLCRTSRE